ncbi:Ig-like domain-containing protein [Arthrobacter sp. H20]|uniref:Ig-like domain-containing protein n=1 Tax=Arthrobacter sp. H20 TaxID=1267981 RepID=UPI00056C0BF7|nr:Ig-like domain-containing protein [Arthrobacter sp. H20]
MNRGLQDFLVAGASDRVELYPASIDRALLTGMRLYRQRVALTTAAAVAVVIALVSVVALTPGWIGGSAAGNDDVVGLVLDPADLTVTLGGTVQFVALAQLENGSTRDVGDHTRWKSLDPGIATVDGFGLATAISPGTATISGAAEGIGSEASLTVLPVGVVALSIILTPPTPAVETGSSQQFTAVAQFSDRSTEDISAAAAWGSTSPAIASVNAGGLATGASPGDTAIIAGWNGLQGSSSLTVIDPPSAPVRIVVEPATARVCSPATQPMTAVGVDAAGKPVDVGPIVWTTNRDDFAVDESGLVTPNETANGEATITAQAAGLAGTGTVSCSQIE